MDKSANAYRTISEVAAELDLPQHVLRFWETRFLQIKPLKRGGGRRYYRPDDIELIRAIKSLLYSEGYTIKGVQRILREQNLRKLLQASKEARELGLPIVLLGPEPIDEAREEGASCLAAEDEHILVDTIAGQDSLPLQEDSNCSPYEILPAALPEDIRHALELLSIELIECRKILNNSN